jgi:hypothetical protein
MYNKESIQYTCIPSALKYRPTKLCTDKTRLNGIGYYATDHRFRSVVPEKLVNIQSTFISTI